MEIRPFQVIHYPFDAKLLTHVVCPPYDKVTDQDIAHYRSRHPHNFVHAIIGNSLSDHSYYKEAAKTLHDWVQEGVLARESAEKILVYRQSYDSPLTGEKLTRTGFFALLRLPERGGNEVLPHERTFSEHKADRLKLYRAVRGNPEAIFVLYSDPTDEVLKRLSSASFGVSFPDPHGHQNEIGLLDSPEAVGAIRGIVESQKLLIADGHHRFETGQNYRDECRAANPGSSGPQPYEYILVYFTALEDPGLVILPTHRLIKGVSKAQLEEFIKRASDFFEIQPSKDPVNPEGIAETAIRLSKLKPNEEAFALATGEGIHWLRLRDREKLKTLLPPEIAEPLRDLPVVWLHRTFLDRFLSVSQEEGAPDRLGYVRTVEEVFNGLKDGGYDACFLLRGTRPEEVKQVAQTGHRMPQKSTDFFPKVLSGIAAYLYDR
jgi:uncharacterized protein (DUF1015 family)